MKKRVAVIGAGLGGLSAASRLARKGFHVDVFEQRDGPGGKASDLRIGGYRFDTGPSLLTLPEVFRQLFSELGEELEDHLEFVRLDPITRYFYPDGTVIDAFPDRERFAAEIEEKTGEKAEKVLRYLERCRKIFDLTSGLFMHRSLQEVGTYLTGDAFRTLSRIGQIDALRTMHRANSEFFSDDRVVKLFDRYATYNGSSPYMTPATFNLIQHVEYGIGGYGVKGGIFEITRRIAKLSGELGVNFHYGKRVEGIGVEGSRVRGITVDGEELPYDIVVSNSDVTNTYNVLLGGNVKDIGSRYASLEPSSSGGVFYFGINTENRELLVNNIFFSGDYEAEFGDIWHRRRAPRDPTVYINITSRIDPEDAPPGCENWFVLVNVPYDSGQDWGSEMKGLRERTMEKIEGALGRSLVNSVEAEASLDPPGIERTWSGNRGSIYGISSNDRRSAFRRQGNRSGKIRGLYFCGGSAHPGGGMPLVILSGRIASDLISKYEQVSVRENRQKPGQVLN